MKVERVFAEDGKHTVEDLIKEFVSNQINSVVQNYKKDRNNKTEQNSNSEQKTLVS